MAVTPEMSEAPPASPPGGEEPPSPHKAAREQENRAFLHLARSRAVNRRFQYLTLLFTTLLLALLLFLSYNVYNDARMDIEEQFNRQQQLLAKQAAGRMTSFFDELMASLRYSARFLRTVGPRHPGRLSAIDGLFERLGGRLRVSEVGYFREPTGDAHQAPGEKEEGEEIPPCPEGSGACLLIVREGGGVPAFLLGVAAVSEEDGLFAKVTLDDIERSFVRPVRSGKRGRAWLLDGRGRILVSPGIPGIAGHRLEDVARAMHAPRLAALARRMAGGGEGHDWHAALGGGRRAPGRRYLTAFAPVKVGGERWTLAISAPSSEVVALVRRTFRKGLFLTAFGLVAVISAALIVLDRERRRIRAEDHLHWSGQVLESKERLEALFDGITDGICILSRRLSILMVNRAMARLLGRDYADLLGRPWRGAGAPVPPPLAGPPPVETTFGTGRRGFAERSVVLAEGRRMDLEFYTYPILGASGEVAQVIVYIKDVTERRALQREVQQRDRLSIVGKMSAQVAHEIRNPLSAINLNAELLGDELLRFDRDATSEAWSLLRSIRAEVDILRQVTEDYLKFVRMPRSERAPGNLNEVIGDLLHFHAEEAGRRGIRIVRDLAPVLPEVALDEAQMRVALQNLLLNAFDAMPRGGRVTVRTRFSRGRVHVEIADEGEGIKAGDQAAVFTPFFTTKASGTGLGLVLTQQIVTEHKGGIHFSSHEGEGTIFHIDLPPAAPQESQA